MSRRHTSMRAAPAATPTTCTPTHHRSSELRRRSGGSSAVVPRVAGGAAEAAADVRRTACRVQRVIRAVGAARAAAWQHVLVAVIGGWVVVGYGWVGHDLGDLRGVGGGEGGGAGSWSVVAGRGITKG